MYQVLYRKWRPKVFADVVGQPQVTVTLRNELQAGRIAHAYLFTGSRGTGKTTCAKILAKAVNCLNPQNGDPCGECEICRGIDSGAVLDVSEIDAASNNGVDNIRDLREEVNFTPAMAKYRVYIIDEVHMLSPGAFNALLKTLEEPPQHVIFILATTELHKIPATILSRCQRLDFHRISPEDMASRIEYVCAQENAQIEHEAALMIARLADGALRDALSLLDQCIGRDTVITPQVVSDAAGLSGSDHLIRLSDALAAQDTQTLLQLVGDLHAASKDMVRLAEELISHFRNIMLFKTMKDPSGIIIAGAEELTEIERQAHLFSLENVLHIMTCLQECVETMAHGGNRRVELEMTLIRLCNPGLDHSAGAVLRRLENLERAVKIGNIRPAPTEPEPIKELPKVKPVAPPSELLAPDEPLVLFDKWPDVVETLHGISPGLAAFLDDSKAYVRGDFFLIDAPNGAAFELLRTQPEQKEKMRRAIQIVTGRLFKLGPYKATPEEQKSAEDPMKQLADLAKDAGIPITENS